MIYAIATVLVLIADQAVKFWTTKNVILSAAGADCVELIPGFMRLTNVHNFGAAFNILQNARWPLVVLSLLFVIAIIILINRELIHTHFGRWTAVMVMAGALGNCIDRMLYGYVVDMFEFEFFTFPVFNVADIFITVSGILFCIHVLLYKEPDEVREANESSFARRMREQRQAKVEAKRREKAEKDALYDRIPKRGEHKSLAEELRAIDPDDPFAEWEFGASAKKAAPKKAEEEKKPLAATEDEDEFDRRFNEKFAHALKAEHDREREPEEEKPEPEDEPKPKKKPKPKPEPAAESEPDFAPAPEPEPRPEPEPEPEPEPDLAFAPTPEEEDSEESPYDYDPAGDFDFDYDPAGDFDFDAPAPKPKKPEPKDKKGDDVSSDLADILSEFSDF